MQLDYLPDKSIFLYHHTFTIDYTTTTLTHLEASYAMLHQVNVCNTTQPCYCCGTQDKHHYHTHYTISNGIGFIVCVGCERKCRYFFDSQVDCKIRIDAIPDEFNIATFQLGRIITRDHVTRMITVILCLRQMGVVGDIIAQIIES